MNDNFEIANNYLGWGDPGNGLWFIGIDEGTTFSQESLKCIRGKKFEPVEDVSNEDFDWNVAKAIAKVAAPIVNDDPVEYRKTRLWRRGSKVFSGNLMPLGRPNLNEWPDSYRNIFDLGIDDHAKYEQIVRSTRYQCFKDFCIEMAPQAIICFGIRMWDDFQKVFTSGSEYAEFKFDKATVRVYEEDKVILTGHISWGMHFPNTAAHFVTSKLMEWEVNLEFR